MRLRSNFDSLLWTGISLLEGIHLEVFILLNVKNFALKRCSRIQILNAFKVDNKHTRKSSFFVIVPSFSAHRLSIRIVGYKLSIASVLISNYVRYFTSTFSLNIFQNSSDNCIFLNDF